MRNLLCIQNRLGRDVACQWLRAPLGYVRDTSVGTRRRGKSDGRSILGCVDEAVGVNFCNVVSLSVHVSISKGWARSYQA
jgi:hypothetical protein